MKRDRKIRDKDMANAEVALQRAAKKAKMIAKQTHTPLILFENGHVIKKFVGKDKDKQGT